MAGTDVLANAWVRLVVLNLIVRLSGARRGAAHTNEASSITYAEIAHRGRTFIYAYMYVGSLNLRPISQSFFFLQA